MASPPKAPKKSSRPSSTEVVGDSFPPPPNKEPLDCRLQPIRLTRSLDQKSKADAAAAGLKVSEYVRHFLAHGQVVVRDKIADTQLMLAFSAMGNNMNQLSRSFHINPYGSPALVERLETALKRHNRLMDILEDKMERDGS